MQGNCNADPNERSVTVMITDACPECDADHIDVQALTFQKVPQLSCLACASAIIYNIPCFHVACNELRHVAWQLPSQYRCVVCCSENNMSMTGHEACS